LSVVHGTVFLCYKAHQVLDVVPDIFKEKNRVAVDREENVDEDMLALVYIHLADGRAATHTSFFTTSFDFSLCTRHYCAHFYYAPGRGRAACC